MNLSIKYFTDEHISKSVIDGLRLRGVDVLSIPEAGMTGSSDNEVLSKARATKRIIVTRDADFLKLHSLGKSHHGIVFIPKEISVGEIISGLMLIYQILEYSDMENHVEFLGK